MSPEQAFRDRAKEVRAYLRSLQDIEQNFSKPGRRFYRSAYAVTASRASVFIMIYNCIEFSVKLSIVNIRKDIHSGQHKFSDLRNFWQEDVIRANFLNRIQQGTKHAELTIDMLQTTRSIVNWEVADRDFPFSGNIDQSQLIRLAKRLEYDWKIPDGTLGGSDLNMIRKNRNDLAHGAETFQDIGSNSNTGTMIEQLDRVRRFISSFLKMMERYRFRKMYLR